MWGGELLDIVTVPSGTDGENRPGNSSSVFKTGQQWPQNMPAVASEQDSSGLRKGQQCPHNMPSVVSEQDSSVLRAGQQWPENSPAVSEQASNVSKTQVSKFVMENVCSVRRARKQAISVIGVGQAICVNLLF